MDNNIDEKFIESSKMGKALKICIDSLIDISNNAPTNDVIRLRAVATIKEVYKIINDK